MKQGFVVWLTGMSGAGKSTLSEALAPRWREKGLAVEILDGDAVRPILSAELGYTREHRDANVARIAWVAGLLAKHGAVVLVAAISPYKAAREQARQDIGRFVEIHVHCTIEELARRDVKGLYKKALAGEIPPFTGVSDPYEAPDNPDVVVNSAVDSLEESIERIEADLTAKGYLA